MLSFFRQPDDSWDTGHTVMRGWLWKMKRKARSSLLPRSAWTRRWFTVESGALQWYHNRSSLVPSGSIPLKTLYSCQLFERSADGTNSSFVVRSKQRSLLLRCDDLRALDYWVRGLNLQMDLLKSDNALRRRKTSRHPDGGRAGTPDQCVARGMRCADAPRLHYCTATTPAVLGLLLLLLLLPAAAFSPLH